MSVLKLCSLPAFFFVVLSSRCRPLLPPPSVFIVLTDALYPPRFAFFSTL